MCLAVKIMCVVDPIARTGDVLDGYGTTKTRSDFANNVCRTTSRHWRGSPLILDNGENIGTQTSKKKPRKRKLETIQEVEATN